MGVCLFSDLLVKIGTRDHLVNVMTYGQVIPTHDFIKTSSVSYPETGYAMEKST